MSDNLDRFFPFLITLGTYSRETQLRFSRGQFIVLAWKSLPEECRKYFDDMPFKQNESGFIKFTFYSLYLMFQLTLPTFLEKGYITQEEYDYLYNYPT